MTSQAVKATLFAWFCEPQAALGCVAGVDSGRERGTSEVSCKFSCLGRNLLGICTTRSRNQANGCKAAIWSV